MSSEPLSDNEIETLRRQLLAARERLQEQLQLSASAEVVEDLDKCLVGRVSRIDALQQQNMARSTRKQSQQTLRRVEAALMRIESGDYGYCGACDEPIARARLSAQPEARLCVHCQEQADRDPNL